jgi:chaperonin GroES
MKINPIGNRVVVELTKQPKTTNSGFILTTEDKTEQQKGTITAVGAGFGEEKDLMIEFKKGQTVIFGKYSGEEIKNDSGEVTHKVVNAKDIFATVE